MTESMEPRELAWREGFRRTASLRREGAEIVLATRGPFGAAERRIPVVRLDPFPILVRRPRTVAMIAGATIGLFGLLHLFPLLVLGGGAKEWLATGVALAIAAALVVRAQRDSRRKIVLRFNSGRVSAALEIPEGAVAIEAIEGLLAHRGISREEPATDAASVDRLRSKGLISDEEYLALRETIHKGGRGNR